MAILAILLKMLAKSLAHRMPSKGLILMTMAALPNPVNLEAVKPVSILHIYKPPTPRVGGFVYLCPTP